MSSISTILYIGGFELPDKNAAAQRVIGIAKGLRELQYEVIFLNSVKNLDSCKTNIKNYFGFKCYEYKRESDKDYLLTAKTAIKHITEIKPETIIAYNYPGIALERIRRLCVKNRIRCIADATEWYQIKKGSFLYKVIKTIDTSYRMKIVQKKLDGVIAISRLLYDYYKDSVNTVMIPPTVDVSDEKWNYSVKKDKDVLSFIYAGSPSSQKERLDLIVKGIEQLNANKRVSLNIVGITKEQFRKIYSMEETISERVIFHGRLEHSKAIEMTKTSDWAIIIRDNNFVVNAGFPTKLVESISCGTPVIINKFSNIEDFIDEKKGIVVEANNLVEAMQQAENSEISPDKTTFDYHRYLKELKRIMGI